MSGFNNSVWQPYELTPTGISEVAKNNGPGKPDTVYVNAVEAQLWAEKLQQERSTTALRQQVHGVEDGLHRQRMAFGNEVDKTGDAIDAETARFYEMRGEVPEGMPL